MTNLKNAIIFLLVAGTNMCAAQEKEKLGHYQMRSLPNGNQVREFVADDPVLAKILEDGVLEANLKATVRNGTAEIIDYLSVVDLNALSDLEVLPYQQLEIKRIVENYRGSIVGKNVDQVNSLKLKTARQIESVLLPRQLASIVRRTNRRNRLLSPLVFSESGLAIGVSDEQKQLIVTKAKHANEIIRRAMADIELQKKRCREEVLSIYDQVLSRDQKEKLAKTLDVEAFVEKMQLKDLEEDTNLKLFRK